MKWLFIFSFLHLPLWAQTDSFRFQVTIGTSQYWIKSNEFYKQDPVDPEPLLIKDSNQMLPNFKASYTIDKKQLDARDKQKAYTSIMGCQPIVTTPEGHEYALCKDGPRMKLKDQKSYQWLSYEHWNVLVKEVQKSIGAIIIGMEINNSIEKNVRGELNQNNSDRSSPGKEDLPQLKINPAKSHEGTQQ